MVAAVHFYGTLEDQLELLDFLGEPEDVVLRSWPLVAARADPLTRQDAVTRSQVTVVSRSLGQPLVLRSGDAALTERSRAGVFNRLNFDRLKSRSDEGLVDSNASPVLLWVPAIQRECVLLSGHIGSQADSMGAVSTDYQRWANRVMNWVRRRGTKVWGLETTDVRPDLDLRRSDVTTVFALPEALAALEDGATGN